MKFSLVLLLWNSAALAEDSPDESPPETSSSAEEDSSEEARPSGLPIRVPPKGAFANEAPDADPAPEESIPPEEPPADEGATLEEGVRPAGQPIRVPPDSAFKGDPKPALEPELDIPGLPTYLLPAVEKQRSQAQPTPALEDPTPPQPLESPPEDGLPESEDDFLDEIEQDLKAELAAERPPPSEEFPQVTVEPDIEIDFATPAPPPDPLTWEAYQARRLRFVPRAREGAFDRGPEWSVKTGSGRQMTAHQFATLVGDTETLDRLDTEESWAVRRGYLLAGAGGAMLVGSAASLINLRNVESQYQTPLPQEGEFTDYAEYLEASESISAANDAQDSAAQEDRVWTAVALGTLGAITLTVAPRSKDAALERQRTAANYYSRSDADHWMNVYNAVVRQELGLPAFEGTPAAPTRRIEEEDYVDDLDTELEELEREESERRDNGSKVPEETNETAPPTETPASDSPGGPVTPGKHAPELELRIGPGWLGLSGRF